MALKPGIPTLQHSVSKRWSRPDNVWISDGLADAVTSCDTLPAQRGPATDHLPIVTLIDIPVVRRKCRTRLKIREVAWKRFREELTAQLAVSPPLDSICTQRELDQAIGQLTSSLQNTIEKVVEKTKFLPNQKRWWNDELTELKHIKSRAANEAYKWRGDPHHPSHKRFQKAQKTYSDAIKATKRQHWDDWLEQAAEKDIWTAGKY
ncbi:hypothetical protein K488DRAFT_65406, partial [Vararia minispora EC-137]